MTASLLSIWSFFWPGIAVALSLALIFVAGPIAWHALTRHRRPSRRRSDWTRARR
jgi:hypothetical protein